MLHLTCSSLTPMADAVNDQREEGSKWREANSCLSSIISFVCVFISRGICIWNTSLQGVFLKYASLPLPDIFTTSPEFWRFSEITLFRIQKQQKGLNPSNQYDLWCLFTCSPIHKSKVKVDLLHFFFCVQICFLEVSYKSCIVGILLFFWAFGMHGVNIISLNNFCVVEGKHQCFFHKHTTKNIP